VLPFDGGVPAGPQHVSCVSRISDLSHLFLDLNHPSPSPPLPPVFGMRCVAMPLSRRSYQRASSCHGGGGWPHPCRQANDAAAAEGLTPIVRDGWSLARRGGRRLSQHWQMEGTQRRCTSPPALMPGRGGVPTQARWERDERIVPTSGESALQPSPDILGLPFALF
jgi:hypothetical protein